MRLFTHNRDDSVRPKDKPTGARKVKLHKSNCYFPIWPNFVCLWNIQVLRRNKQSILHGTYYIKDTSVTYREVVIGYIRRFSVRTLE